jgi:glycosyltransferase involved in cell wall biosynthesis
MRFPRTLVLHNKKVIVVLPAYRAARTVERTYRDLPLDLVDEVLLVDDAGGDETAEISKRLGIKTVLHRKNMGYGGNQKTCYYEALRAGADIVVMVHPDYQYDPRLVSAMAAMVASGVYDAVLGSRIGTAREGGMPIWKYIANRSLTAIENLLLGTKLTEFHTGYRAFSRKVLYSLPLLANSDDFVFDNQMIAQLAAFNFRIGEISCPTKYFSEASSINFRRSVKYGFGVLLTSLLYRLWKWKLAKPKIFADNPASRIDSRNAETRHVETVVAT